MASFWLVVHFVILLRLRLRSQLNGIVEGWRLRRQLESDLEMVINSEESIERVRDLIVLKSSATLDSQKARLREFLFDDQGRLWP